MSKRPLEDDQPDHKAKKVKTQTLIDITSARQLQQILAFQQDAIPQLRTAIKSFKVFLESIVYVEDKQTSVKQQAILQEFLDSQLPRDDGAVFLPSLMQAWGFAQQTNNDGLLSAVSAILALLMKTVSSLLDIRSHGKVFVETLLKQDQLKIIWKSLISPKQKEHLISPVIRLLTETVSFDGGSMAAKVFAARSSTFDAKSLARNLSLGSVGRDTKGARDLPTVRSNSVQYLLALARLLPISAKIELLKHGVVFKSLFDGLRNDGPELIRHTLQTLRNSLLADDSIPKKVKGYIFTTHNLLSITTLCRQDRHTKDKEHSPAQLAHEFLTYVCTAATAGVLRPQTAFYPQGTIKADVEQTEDTDARGIDLGLDSISWYNSFRTQVPVRNGVLSMFAQQLKPYSHEPERRLLLSILENAPELVADYFFKSAFAFDPKLTPTWIGFSAFVFSVVQLPLPPAFGREESDPALPPPISILIESILPRPLNAKVLTKCLNQQSELITYFAARILVLAFGKLQNACSIFQESAVENGQLWNEAKKRLRREFSSRCPPLKDVIASYRKLKGASSLQRETMLRLIAFYYTTSPQSVTEDTFDASVPLVSALDSFEQDKEARTGLERLELGHLLRISQSTSATRWWHKPEGLRFSPFVCLLKIVASDATANGPSGTRQILSAVLREHDVLQFATGVSAVDALIASLKPSSEWQPPDTVYTWLDDVLARFVKRPIKYLDDLDAMEPASQRASTSPVWMALVEQWPFLVSRDEASADIAVWLGRYISLSKAIGEDSGCLDKALRTFTKVDDLNKAASKALKKTAAEDHQRALPARAISTTAAAPPNGIIHDHKAIAEAEGLDAEHFKPPTQNDVHARELHSALSMSFSDAATSGALGSLILCLSDTDVDVRTQSLTNLNSILKRLNAPEAQIAFPQSKQLYLLLGVLCNTASKLLKKSRAQNDAKTVESQSDNDEEDDLEGDVDLPVPYTVTAFASMAVPIVADPRHPLYANINKFVLRGPSWDPDRLPSYWVHSLLRTPPADTVLSTPASSASTTAPDTRSAPTARFDRTLLPLTTLPAFNPFPHSSYHTGVHFLLGYVYHLLRSKGDLAILQRRGTFEPLFALASDPALPSVLLDSILAIAWRATCLHGGSTTLITRAGVVTWLKGLLARRAGRSGGLAGPVEIRALLARVWQTADKVRVERWAGGTLEAAIHRPRGEE